MITTNNRNNVSFKAQLHLTKPVVKKLGLSREDVALIENNFAESTAYLGGTDKTFYVGDNSKLSNLPYNDGWKFVKGELKGADGKSAHKLSVEFALPTDGNTKKVQNFLTQTFIKFNALKTFLK